MPASITQLLRLLQFGDSMLPVGAFSFSNGLEAAIAERVVHDVPSLRAFVATALEQSAGGDGIALLAAHRGALTGDMDRVMLADEAVLLRKLNEETRTMTTRMGRKLAEMAGRVLEAPLTGRWLDRIAARETPGTFPVALALVFADSRLSEQEAFAAHQYGVATMMQGAALRLMKLNYLDGQALLHDVNGMAEEAYARIATAGLDDMAAFAPMVDILAAIHVKSHVRMFMN
jgi:urease accessory protein